MLVSKRYQDIQFFSGSDKPIILFFLLVNAMPTVFGFFNINEQEQIRAQLS